MIGRYLVEHAAHGPSAATAAHNAQALATWWGSRPVAEVTPATCRAYAQSRRRAGRSAATVRRELSVLSAALRHEVREGRLKSAPVVPMPAPPPARDRWLTRAEVASLLRAAKANPQRRRGAARFILLALYTGGRRQALLELRWSQIDLERGVLDLNPPGRTQTTKGRPRLPIPRRLMTFLKIWGRGAASDAPVIGRGGRGRSGRRGSPARAVQGVRTGFRAAVAEAGLEGVTPHTLRHTAATWLAQAGVDLWQIAGWLGHSVGRITERYAHHHPAYLADARNALDRPRQVSVAVSVAGRKRRSD